MAQIKKVFSDSEASSSSADEKISGEKYAKLEAERYEYMIRYSAYFDNAKDLRPTLYDEKVIGPGYTPMFLTHSDEALEIKMFKRSKENKIDSPFQQTSSLKPYVPNVILEKIII
nr:hypothetical protein [Tanacetum cinerariifolium]